MALRAIPTTHNSTCKQKPNTKKERKKNKERNEKTNKHQERVCPKMVILGGVILDQIPPIYKNQWIIQFSFVSKKQYATPQTEQSIKIKK